MANTRIKEFFNSRFFEIPKYQRGYAWEKKHVRELFEDIQEAIDVKASHYIGTIVLSKSSKNDVFYVVDGQQRITTLTMIINALMKHLSKDDRSYYSRFYIKHSDNFRLVPLGRENGFFKQLINNGVEKLDPINRSQRLLVESYQEITDRLVHVLKTMDAITFLDYIENLQIMEFVEDNEGDAIRIFQTVNDRGKPLTNMEKAKSLLVYFSNRYLNRKLDKKINDDFGTIFEIYDQIKHTGIENEIALIAGRYGVFNEDNIMRYHFVTFSGEDYDPSANFVLEYLKRELKKFRKGKKAQEKIEDFITNYVDSLLEFFKSLNELIQYSNVDRKYFKLFSILGLSATLYPVITILNSQKRLENNLKDKGYEEFTLLDLIEIIDVRVYKIRGTDPKADISRFAFDLANSKKTDLQVENWLSWFNERWMNENEFRNNLYSSIYQKSRAVLPHILLDYSESLTGKEANLVSLKNFTKKKALTIEHILSQKPKFTLRTHGFRSSDDYLEHEHTLGNLTLLEKSLNSSVNNKHVFDKIPYYDKSKFKITKKLATKLAHLGQFKKLDIEARTEKIANYLEEKWWC